MAVQTEKSWHNLEIGEALKFLNADRRGLSQEEAKRRLAKFGPNELVEEKKASPWVIFLAQFKDLLIIVLLVAVALSAVMGEVADAIVIFVIVLFATILGFVQEYRAEKAMEALKQMTAPTASVIRGGEEAERASREIVPGDIILLHTGDKVPADARLIEEVNLRIDEASLTGESVPVEKMTGPLAEAAAIGDRKNMVYMGTAAVYGRGTAVVTTTGMNTEFGKIAAMLQTVKVEATPLQVSLDRMSKWIIIGALTLCFILAGMGVLKGNPILEMFVWGVSLAVAAVPEALPAVVTIGLAIGVQRLVKHHALVRKLPAVETLGCTTVICSDKTGTLTQDQMTVRRIYTNGKLIEVSGVGYEPKGSFFLNSAVYEPQKDVHLETLLRIGSLCNDTRLVLADGKWEIKGDPTEGALVVAAAKAGLEQETQKSSWPRVDEIPFSSERKMMTTVHQTPQGMVAYAKGAPEVILACCRYIYWDEKPPELTSNKREEILDIAETMAGDGLRVLGLAYKPLSQFSEAIECHMVFVGLVGMIDPPREEVQEAIKVCDQAGIKSVMITGDHKITAIAIARELGLLKKGRALSGVEVDILSDEQLEGLVEEVEVYARVSPAHKLRVVDALIRRGHVVAMTGDGVNDAPALKKADIGVAMGITGTHVSKEAADIVLTDDNFASIVAAVKEGRGIYDNIKKYLMFLLSSNLGEILLMAVGILFGSLLGTGGALPLIAVQILYVNLATDGLPAIALAVDPASPDIMRRKARPRTETIFTRSVLSLIVIGGIWSMIVNLGIFLWALGVGKNLLEARCLVFMTLVIIQFFKAFNYRSDRLSIFKIGFFTNRWLILAIFWECIMLSLVIYLPFLQGLFRTYSLGVTDWIIVIGSSATIIPVLEIAKFIFRRQQESTILKQLR